MPRNRALKSKYKLKQVPTLDAVGSFMKRGWVFIGSLPGREAKRAGFFVGKKK
jgi:hypothetical protein